MLRHMYEMVYNEEYRILKYLEEDIEDIKKFMFFKKYNKHYNDMNWYLEEGAKEFIKQVEDDWLANKLDTDAIYKDSYIYEMYAKNVAKDLHFQNMIDDDIDYRDYEVVILG